MLMFSLESAIAPDAFARLVDAFVDTIDLKGFGFAHVFVIRVPALHSHYTQTRTRSPYKHIDAMWLLSGLNPQYKTIADFRKNHPKTFREIFRRFVWLLKQWNLIDGHAIAIDVNDTHALAPMAISMCIKCAGYRPGPEKSGSGTEFPKILPGFR